ncbi:c-type cytochrome biogenesis protein CcmI [Rhizobium sp. EC-SD404]|uniref:c-type cytochrome biogenesis protein CcmI n=1 Tax=Rhizobium sp. EC-SD404 TaxID=2038389 RepID=UPI001252BBE2|nr:c-type cytochrome biogenesis protein CcmI [Rhizobium sp. EC-SD404]VVT14306.1 Cytochrome c-type biogenesis protein CycH [Rhizobium sp. EC-SD404]
MMFWVLAAVLTALVTIALLLPLARGRRAGNDAEYDVEVYSDQLAEVERDRAGGLIGTDEATHARAEIGRRLLRAKKTQMAATVRRGGGRVVSAARFCVLVGVPLLGISVYLATGAPGVPDQPLASRAPTPEEASPIATMIAQAEQHLQENPDDGRGWDVLAPIYLRAGQLQEARTAYLNAIRLLGPSSARQSGYGEALVALASGVVTDEAVVAFQSARELQPDEPKAAFYLALALEQEGRNDRALEAFRRLAEQSPPDAPWMTVVNEKITTLGGQVADISPSGLPPLTLLPDAENDAGAVSDDAVDTRPPTQPGPTEEDMAAARDMSDDERQVMIQTMVGNLDRRLRENPQDIDGWIRLVRSYGVLGQPEQAGEALARGLAVFPEESEDGRALLAVARQVGVDRPEEEGAQ